MLKRELDAVFFVSAARYGRLEKVSAMVEAGADVNAVGDENYTALHVAVLRNHAKVIEFLVRAGADVFAKNDAGETPFGLAQKVGGAASLAICGVQLQRGECAVCMEDDSALYPLPCGDFTCVDCVVSWFLSLIKENAPLRCPLSMCSKKEALPTHMDVNKLLSRDMATTWDEQMLRRCLAATADFQNCKSCDSGGFMHDLCATMICPDCNDFWCMECDLPHSEMTCAEFKVRYDAEHQESMQWKEINCKKCPQCKTYIWRDGGCSHMQCRQCRYEFCWWCLGKYQPGRYTFDDGNCPCDPPSPTDATEAAADPRGETQAVVEGGAADWAAEACDWGAATVDWAGQGAGWAHVSGEWRGDEGEEAPVEVAQEAVPPGPAPAVDPASFWARFVFTQS